MRLLEDTCEELPIRLDRANHHVQNQAPRHHIERRHSLWRNSVGKFMTIKSLAIVKAILAIKQQQVDARSISGKKTEVYASTNGRGSERRASSLCYIQRWRGRCSRSHGLNVRNGAIAVL